MSIASEITRLQQAKASLKTAINAKGGTITDETIDEYASKVSALPSPKEEETKTVIPNFASGNVVVTPTSGKVMTQVTVNKDTTNHKAENIKKDITLYGVTGTLESGGGNSLEEYGVVFTLCYTSDPNYYFPLTKVEIYIGTTLVHTSNEYPSGLEDGIYTWLFNGQSSINTNAFKIRLYGGAGEYVNYAKIIGLSSDDTSAWAYPNLVNLTKAEGTGYTEWTCSVSSYVKVIVCLIGNND